MRVLLSSRLRTWLALAIAIPVMRAVVRRARTAAQHRDSDSFFTAALARADILLTRLDRCRGVRRGCGRGRYRTRGAKGGWL